MMGRHVNMGLQLTIGLLHRGQAALALPLVRTLRPGLTLEEWESYLDLLDEAQSDDVEDSCLAGVVAVRDQNGYLHGIFTYTVVEDIVHGRALQVENLVAVDMLGRDTSACMMIKEMDRIAALQGRDNVGEEELEAIVRLIGEARQRL